MTRNDVKERLTRAKDAEHDILLLDGEHRWAMDNIADLKRIQSHNDLAPAIASLKRYDRGIVAQRDALLHMRGGGTCSDQARPRCARAGDSTPPLCGA